MPCKKRKRKGGIASWTGARGAHSRVLIVFLLVAPVILAATMMWAMWDPSKYMRQIDLAVVNEDAGVEKQGKYVNYGDQVVEASWKLTT